MRAHSDKLAIERKEFDAFDQRVKVLQSSVSEARRAWKRLPSAIGWPRRWPSAFDQLSKQMTVLDANAESLQNKQTALDGLQDSLGQVDELANGPPGSTTSNRAGRSSSRCARVWRTSTRRTPRPCSFAIGSPWTAHPSSRSSNAPRPSAQGCRCSTRGWTAITSKLAIVDEGTEKAANLVTLADDLDRRMSRVDGQQQSIERVEARLNGLDVLTGEADRKLEDDRAPRRGRGPEQPDDGPAIAVPTPGRSSRLMAIQAKLLPLTSQLSTLQQPDREGARPVRGRAHASDPGQPGAAPDRVLSVGRTPTERRRSG